jgi:glycosyltransferase involved in cell wall biosynthesis
MTPAGNGHRTARPLRIAQVAPLYESVPPKLYGGTERIVSYLTEELIEQGHHVTLFASGDSRTSAELVAPCEQAIRLDDNAPDAAALHVLMLEQLNQHAYDFDIIHFHTEHIQLPFARRQATPCLVTLHGRLDVPGLAELYEEFRDVPVVSISNAQREPLPGARWQATVYHGLPANLHCCGLEPEGYLAFLGRIAPEKGVDRAIEIAQRAGVPLKIAAKVDPADQEYFAREIEPRIDGTSVQLVGEINESQKTAFLGKARALLFPIDWPEPFGLVMIESMACGTPSIAFRRGSVPEVIDEGVTGFIVESIDDAVAAVGRTESLDRRRCRQVFENRFSAARMADDYYRIYQELLLRRQHAHAGFAANTSALDFG